MGKNAFCIIAMVIAVFCALLCVGLVFFCNFKNGGVVTIDAFLGVAAALIGICATIVVAFQVISYFEFKDLKDKIEQIDIIKSDFFEHITKTKNKLQDMQVSYSNFVFSSSLYESDELIKIDMMINAILLFYSIELFTDQNIKAMIARYQALNKVLGTLDELGDTMIVRESWNNLKHINMPKQLANDEINILHCSTIAKISALLEEGKKKQNNEQIKDAEPE